MDVDVDITSIKRQSDMTSASNLHDIFLAWVVGSWQVCVCVSACVCV